MYAFGAAREKIRYKVGKNNYTQIERVFGV